MDLNINPDEIPDDIWELDLQSLQYDGGVANVELEADPTIWMSFLREPDGLAISTSVERTSEMEQDGWVLSDYPDRELWDIGVGFGDTDEIAELVAKWFIRGVMPAGPKYVAAPEVPDATEITRHWERVDDDPEFVIGMRFVPESE